MGGIFYLIWRNYKIMNIKKRSGVLEPFQIDKIHRVLEWATEGIEDVSISDIEMNAQLNITEGISTKDIHDILIKSANNLISIETPNYQHVAARLLNYSLRKQVWGESEPPRLIDHIKKCVKNNIYDKYVLENYSDSEIMKLGKYLKHDRDNLFTYSGIQQLVDKYLIKNRNTGEIFETPQFAYMLIAMVCFAKYDSKVRVQYVKRAYDAFSTFKINLPTPIMAGVRTNIKQFASCILIDVDDSLDSIFASNSAIGMYTSKGAGIGLNVGRIRPINSPIREGKSIHTGLIPYLKMFESTCKCTSQNSIRGGSSTCNIQFWHYEIEDVVVLKNNAGTDDNRVRKLDYIVHFSKIFYERLIKGEDITLFSPNECPELYSSFGLPEFDELYKIREADTTLQFKKKISAKAFAELFSRERLETGRIYIMNIDNVNTNNSFDEKINMTNLCCITGDTDIECLINGLPVTLTVMELINCYNHSNDIKILSKNVETGIIDYQKIKDVDLTRNDAELISIVDEETGKELICTPDHLIYTKNRGYIRCDNLNENDVLDIIN